MKRMIFHVVIPVAILVAAVFGARKIVSMAKPPERKTAEELAPVVETVRARPEDMTMRVTVTGTVVPAKKVTLTPEVSGRVVKISSSLVPGAQFKKGEIIARLDSRDYELALDQEENRVEQAELALKVEAGRAEIALHELELLERDKNTKTAVSQLARREPHLKAAAQAKKSATSSLERAKLNLGRTVIRAPFNGVVLRKHVDVGQLVGPSTPIATLIGSDEVWAELSVPVEKLPYIQIPGFSGNEGSAVEITHTIGEGRSVRRSGRVIRLQGELDSQNRTATLLVSIDNPFDSEKSEIPLLAGAYVTAKILSNETVVGIDLPRQALIDDSYLWIVDKDNSIQKQTVDVGWRSRNNVVIVGGLLPDTPVVVSPMAKPVAGMKVAPIDQVKRDSKVSVTGRKGEKVRSLGDGSGGE